MAKNRVAQSRVHITDDRGVRHAFDPGDEIPEELMEFVTSEAVFRQERPNVVAPADPNVDMTMQNGEKEKLEDLPYKTLLGMAKDAGITFDGNPKKDDVVDALRAHELNGPETDDDDDDEEDLD